MARRTDGPGSTVDVEDIDDDVRAAVFEPDEGTRAASADRLDMPTLEMFRVSFELSRAGKGAVWVDGTLHAEGEQTCVVTLEPLPAVVDCQFSGVCVPSDSPELLREDVSLEEDEVEILGEIADGRIDLAEIAVQQLSLELDPFPRKEGAEAAHSKVLADSEEGQSDSQSDSPFAALAALKKTLE